MKNECDIRLSIRQARKLHVLEEVTCGKMTNKEALEALEALGLSPRLGGVSQRSFYMNSIGIISAIL